MCFGSSSPDYSAAAQMQAQGAADSIATQERMLAQARADVAPWRQSGTAAETTLGGLYNLPGYTPVDPTKTLEATPGYKWALDQGIGALDASAAARGLALSGPQRNAVQTFGQNFALTNAWQPYLNQLNTMSGRGLQAGGMSGNWAMTAGHNIGNTQMAAADALARGQIQQANADAQSGAGLWQGLGTGLGLLGSLATIPLSGGTSLLGMGLSGLGLGGSAAGAAGAGIGAAGAGFDIASQAPNFMSSLASIPLPMEKGGTALPDQSYIIGEKGPELFIPSTGGTIISNKDLTVFAPWHTT